MACALELKIASLLTVSGFEQVKQIHGFLLTTSLYRYLPSFSKFLRRSTEFGSMDYPLLIFSDMGHVFYKEIVLWNLMIRGYAYNGPPDKCLQLFDEMSHRELRADSYTYPNVLNACSELGLVRKGLNIHCQIVKSGHLSNFSVIYSLFSLYIKMRGGLSPGNNGKVVDVRKVFDEMSVKTVEVWNQMISEYVKINHMMCARQLFDEMTDRDVVSWNSMISGYSKAKDVVNAREFFDRMPDKNVISWTAMIGVYNEAGDVETSRKFFEKMPSRNMVSWNSMISSYTQHGRFKDALNLFTRMQSENQIPDGYTFVSVLTSCSHLGALKFGKWIHSMIKDWSLSNVIVRTSLVDMYAKCGDINTAFTLFVKSGTKDVFCWNVMIKSLAIHGRIQDSMKIFMLMQKEGIKPNDFTFTSALFACSHGGLVKQGQEIFYSMDRDFGICPKIEHYGCLVDLLSRNGDIEEAEVLIKSMPFKPDIAIWGALLGGCKARSDLELAEKVIERAKELEEKEAGGVHVLLSNIHASVGQWPRAFSARESIDTKEAVKEPGWSSLL